MSHKDFVKQWDQFVYQDEKTKHYQQIETLLKELFGERTKENGFFKQIIELEQHLNTTRRGITDINRNPSRPVSMIIPNTNVFLSYTSEEAVGMLSKDQSNLIRDVEIVRTQLKLCCEHQLELEKKIRASPIWSEFCEKIGQKIQH